MENISLVDTNIGKLIAAILSIVEPEKIICFGRRMSQLQAWSSFAADSEKSFSVAYDLLIIIRADEKRSAHELVDMIDSTLSERKIKAMVLIHGIDSVNQALMEGSIFFTTVCRSGSVVYDNGGTVNLPGRARARRRDTSPMEQVWREVFGLAQQFLNGALHFSSSGCNNIALFMLHQAIEQTCNALVRVMTGYRPATHNLSRLLAMTENFCTLSGQVFPRNTPEEIELFRIVARAYSDVRYKAGFQASGRDAMTLAERVASLQRGAEQLYKDKKYKPVRHCDHEIPNALK